MLRTRMQKFGVPGNARIARWVGINREPPEPEDRSSISCAVKGRVAATNFELNDKTQGFVRIDADKSRREGRSAWLSQISGRHPFRRRINIDRIRGQKPSYGRLAMSGRSQGTDRLK